MQHTPVGGPGNAGKSLHLILLILVIWSLAAGSSFTPVAQATYATATSGAQATNTDLPSATPSVTATVPDLATALHLPTSTIRPSATIELPATDTPIPPVEISGEYVEDEVLVRFRRKAARESINGCLNAAGASIESEIEELSVLVVKVPKGRVGAAIARLSGCPDIRLAEPNYIVHIADTIPSDPDLSAQYGLTNIRAPQGWDLSTGSAAVTIAIVDTGVDLGHPDLSAKIVGGYDFVNNDNTAQDDNGHGTHVAGIAAAITNNGTGVAGVSWGALIMPVKVLNSAGNGTFADVAAGITWAADNGAQGINLSLGGTSSSTVLQDAVDYAYRKGAVIVAASGNSGTNFVLYPARYPHVIAVAATDSTNTSAGFSNYGPEVDLAAPGVAILSTLPGSYGYLTGTSMSAPYVSGLASILRGIPGIGSADAIAYDMESTALDLGPSGSDVLYGHGLIQMDAAINVALSGTATPTLVPAPTSAPNGGNGSVGQVNYPPYQPGIGTPTQTFTPSSWPTFTLTASPIGTSTLLAGTPTKSAALGAMSDTARSVSLTQALTSKLGTEWPLGCGGTILILLGAWRVWALSRKGGNRRGGRQYLKTR